MTTVTYAEFLGSKAAAEPEHGRIIDVGDVDPQLHPWQAEIVRWAVRKGRAALWEDTGLGKAQPVDEPVLTPAGWRSIGDLGVGDQVITVDGTATRITGIYPQGERAVVRVTMNDGAWTRCDADHLWTVQTDLGLSRGRSWRTLSTAQMQAAGLREGAGRRDRWRIPVVRPVEYPPADLLIDPYVMGVLLGDGSFRSASITFTSADPEIAAEVKSRLPQHMRLSVVLDKNLPTATAYRIVVQGMTNWNKTNPYLGATVEWGLRGKMAHEKFAPRAYLTGSPSQRLDLLRGLMDTDGYVSASGTVQFGTSSPALADAVVELVQSLGGVARRSRKIPTYHHLGERRWGREHWTLTIAMPDGAVPFLLPRKVERCRSRYYVPQRKIRSIDPDGTAQCVCISVEHPSQLYVTRGHIVTHNTVQQLEWARLSADTSLIVAPLAVCHQTVREADQMLNLPVRYVRSSADVDGPGVWITNTELVDRFDPARFGAVALDEASILKNATGKTRTRLIEHFADVPARLACTATPAPNDPEELTSQAEFLGVCSRVDMLATYFIHDDEGWRLKRHAVEPMYRWMASWAVALRRPSDLGPQYSDDGYDLPGLDIVPELLAVDVEAEGQLFATDLGGVSGRAKVRRDTLGDRCARAADLVAAEPDEPWLLWCGMNAEADELAEIIPGAVNVHGAMSPEDKAAALLGFADGTVRHLITKPKIASFGMNYQHCARMAFVGLSDSYEQYYQAIRRSYRYGQQRIVRAHVVLSELEGQIARNVERKGRESSALTDGLVAAMRAAHNMQEAAA